MATSIIKDIEGVEEFTCTYPISGSSCTSRGYYNKATKTVILFASFHMSYSASNPVGQATPIWVIPSAYRPSTDQTVPLMGAANGSVPIAFYGKIATDGKIYQSITSACVDCFLATAYKL